MNRSRTDLSDAGQISWTRTCLFNSLRGDKVKASLRKLFNKIKPASDNSRSVHGIRNQGVRDRKMEKLDAASRPTFRCETPALAERSAARKSAQAGLLVCEADDG